MGTPKGNWTHQDATDAKHVGTMEIVVQLPFKKSADWIHEEFEIVALPDKLIFGGVCNTGLIQSGYYLREVHESLDETLQELHADLLVYYDPKQGPQYTSSRFVCNERM